MIGRRAPRPSRSGRLVFPVLAVALSAALQAQPAVPAAPPPVVPGYEHLRLAGAAGEAALGEVLLGELNCLSCHEPTPEVSKRIPTRTAPDLAELNERVTVEWLAAYLADPDEHKPGSTMPEVLHSLDPEDRNRVARSIARYLFYEEEPPEPDGAPHPADDAGDGVADEFPVFRFRAAVERGRRLFHSVGCVACHAPEASGAEPAIPSVPLPDLAGKTSVAALSTFLLDPRSTRPGGRMPSLYLTPAEAEDLAIYLLRDQEPQVVERRQGFEFEYFLDPMQDEDVRGFFDRPPTGLDAIEPAAEGRIRSLSLRLPVEMNYGNHAYRFTGVMRAPATGPYTFTLASDRRSGSSLAVDGEVAASKTAGSAREVDAQLELEAGDHPVEVTYFIRGDTEEPFLHVHLEGASLPRGAVLGDYTSYENVRLRPDGGTLVSRDAEAAGWARDSSFATAAPRATATPESRPTGGMSPIRRLSPTWIRPPWSTDPACTQATTRRAIRWPTTRGARSGPHSRRFPIVRSRGTPPIRSYTRWRATTATPATSDAPATRKSAARTLCARRTSRSWAARTLATRGGCRLRSTAPAAS